MTTAADIRKAITDTLVAVKGASYTGLIRARMDYIAPAWDVYRRAILPPSRNRPDYDDLEPANIFYIMYDLAADADMQADPELMAHTARRVYVVRRKMHDLERHQQQQQGGGGATPQ